MNKILLLVFSLASFSLFSQTAPDFTVTDTHGEEHSLYEDYLDQGKTVVLDLFFVNCPPCNDLAPVLEPVYQQWGAGQADVQFISLTSDQSDNDARVIGFEQQHGTTWPAVSADGGGPAAQQPYTTGQFGEFFGYPTLIVIAPDRSVQFDAWGNSLAQTVEILNTWISNTGATGNVVSSTKDVEAIELGIYPNPTTDLINFNSNELFEQVQIANTMGQIVQLQNGVRNQINVSGLTKGHYFIKAITEDNQVYHTSFNKK